MAEAILVEPKIRAGAEVLQALDDELGEVFTAFWYRDPETDDWHLVIGSDVVDREGPTRANSRLLKILKGKDTELSPLEVDLVGRRDPLVEAIRTLKTQPMTLRAPMHIYRTMLGGHYVDDAYVYRSVIRPASIPSQEIMGTPTVTLSPPPAERRRRRPKSQRERAEDPVRDDGAGNGTAGPAPGR